MTAPTDQQIRDAETWEQCKALELQLRRAWMQAQAAKYESGTLMAKGLGVNKSHLCRTAKALGVKLPHGKGGPKGHNEDKLEAYRKCASDGLTVPQTAKRLNVDISTVYGAQKRYGLRFKSVPRGPKRGKPPANAPTMSMAEYARLENAAMKRRSSIG